MECLIKTEMLLEPCGHKIFIALASRSQPKSSRSLQNRRHISKMYIFQHHLLLRLPSSCEVHFVPEYRIVRIRHVQQWLGAILWTKLIASTLLILQ
jgi:hypothetical protein